MRREYQKLLLDIARTSIEEVLTGCRFLDREELLRDYLFLREKRAVFVTLNKRVNGRKELRGCIGSIIPYRSLLDDVIANARAAAFSDPRFEPVSSLDEMRQIDIEISLLTVPKRLEYIDPEDLRRKIVAGRDGVVLKLNGRQATFLPQVWEQLPDFDMFFEHLCRKAGLPGDCLRYHPEIDIYQVEKFEEDDFRS